MTSKIQCENFVEIYGKKIYDLVYQYQGSSIATKRGEDFFKTKFSKNTKNI